MTKLLITAAALAIAASGTANATAYAFSHLTTSNVSVTFSPTATFPAGSSIFSQNAAALNGTDPSLNQTSGIPGIPDAGSAGVGTGTAAGNNMFDPLNLMPNGARGDSLLDVSGAVASFSTVAEGAVSNGAFASSSGRVGASLLFTTSAPTTGLVIVIDYNRVFNLTTGIPGDSALGRTTLTFTLTGNDILLSPSISLSDPACDPNAAPSVGGAGGSFSNNCTGSATFTFATIPTGNYTLNFQSSSNIDIVAGTNRVPEPAALGLLGLSVLGLGLKRRRR